MAELEEWVDFLFSEQTGYVYAPVRKSISEWTPKFFQWPQEREQLVSWIAVWGGSADVFLAPALFKDKNAVKKSVKGSQVVWAEFDGQAKNLESVPEPSAVIQSSKENHFHIYWRIPFMPGEVIEDINRRLTYNLGADSSGWDSTQILRPPTTINFKRNLPVLLKSLIGTNYDTAHFDSLPKIPLPPTAPGIETLPSILKVLSQNKFTDNLLNLIENPKDEVGERSTYLMHVGYCLAEAGLTYEESVSILLYADEKAGKFVGRSDRLQRISEIASRALHEKGPNDEPTESSYSAEEILNDDASIEFVWEPFLPREGRLLVTGSPGVGKTLFTTSLAMHLAIGRDFLGFKTSAACRVLYIQMEMPLPGVKRQLTKQVKLFTTEEWQAVSKNLIFVPTGYQISFEEIRKHIKKEKPDVLFIDSMIQASQGDLSGEEEPRRIFNWMDAFRNEFGLAAVLIHHNRKASDGNKKPNSLADVYGSIIIQAKTDTALILWRDDDKKPIEVIPDKIRYDYVPKFWYKRDEHLHGFLTTKDGKALDSGNTAAIQEGNSPEPPETSGIGIVFKDGDPFGTGH